MKVYGKDEMNKFRKSQRMNMQERKRTEKKKTLKEDFTTDYTATFLPTTTAATDNAISVEEYLGTLMQSVVETWGLHLNTNKYSEHIALNEFYDEMIDLVDTLIENYKGIYGNIPTKPNVFKPEASSAAEYLGEFRAFVENGKSLFTDSELLSDIDSILSAIDECLYKVENLTENRKRKMVKESINIDEEQIIDITNEMKEKYPSLKKYDEIIISGKKMNFDEAEEYAKENNAVLPNIKEGNDIVKFVVDGRKHISFEAWTREGANNAENAVYTVSTNGVVYTSDNNKDKPLAKKKVFCLRPIIKRMNPIKEVIILKGENAMKHQRTIRESVSNETIYIDKERIPTAHYVFDVRIGDIDFIVTAESGYGDAESEAIDKVVEYCINSVDNEDYYNLLPIFTYDDISVNFKDFEFDDPDYADEAINDYIMNDFTVALDSNYFIPNHEISVKDVTQSMRRSFRNCRSY